MTKGEAIATPVAADDAAQMLAATVQATPVSNQ
jgi:hypothetical protein